MSAALEMKQAMNALEKIASIGLTTSESRVLAEMLWSIDESNLIDVPVRVIAEETGFDRSSVSKAIKRLIEVDVLQKVVSKTDRRRSIYLLNDHKKWGESILPPPSNVIHANFRRGNKQNKGTT